MNRKQYLVSLICLALCSLFVLAQTPTTARLNGNVVDVLGAAIPKVQITISNSAASYNVVSDENGKFSINLPAGTYQLRSDKLPGFAATERNLVIETGKPTDVTIVPAVSVDNPLIVPGGPVTKHHKRKRHRPAPASNNSLDRSGGWVLGIIIGPAKVEW